MRTYQPRARDIKRNWHLVDARGKALGRMATKVATYLMGKHKPTYASHMDMGDYVVVVNARDVELTGKKVKQKVYRRHSGYPGGFKEVKFKKLIEEQPEKVIEHAVSGMLPKNRLHQKRMRRLRIVAGSDNPYKKQFMRSKKEVL